jgi:hypothetical protein
MGVQGERYVKPIFFAVARGAILFNETAQVGIMDDQKSDSFKLRALFHRQFYDAPLRFEAQQAHV